MMHSLVCANVADVNSNETGCGWTPLVRAAEKGSNEVVRALLENRAIIDVATEPRGWTPLYAAAANGHVAVVNTLIQGGADVNQEESRHGATPLYIAAQNGHVQVVVILLRAGGDTEKALSEEADNVLGTRTASAMEVCGNAGGYTHAAATPLYTAAEQGHVEVVRALLEDGAITDVATEPRGFTPLYAAAANGYVAVVNTLVQGGADVNQEESRHGATPLYIAAQNGHVQVVEILLRAGGDTEKALSEEADNVLGTRTASRKIFPERSLLGSRGNIST